MQAVKSQFYSHWQKQEEQSIQFHSLSRKRQSKKKDTCHSFSCFFVSYDIGGKADVMFYYVHDVSVETIPERATLMLHNGPIWQPGWKVSDLDGWCSHSLCNEHLFYPNAYKKGAHFVRRKTTLLLSIMKFQLSTLVLASLAVAPILAQQENCNCDPSDTECISGCGMLIHPMSFFCNAY